MQQRQNFGATQSQSSRPRQRISSQRRRGPTGVASLRYLPSGLFLQLEAPYNKPFTDELKKSLPSKKRMWDNNDKCWYVVKDQFDKLTHLLEKHYTETILLDFPEQETATDAWSVMWLLPGAPLEIVRAAFKALAVKYHPDRGGSVEDMQALNIAHTEILGEFAEKGV